MWRSVGAQIESRAHRAFLGQAIVQKAFDFNLRPITMDFSAFFTIKKGAQILEFYTEKVNKMRKCFLPINQKMIF